MIDSDQNVPGNSQPEKGEIDLKQLFDILWESKKIILGITLAFSLLSIFYSLSLPNYYTSGSVLVARDSQGSGALSQYSGLASLAGVSLPSTGDTSVYEVIEIIKSREFVKHLITFDEVLPSLMAAESYDKLTKKVKFDNEIYDPDKQEWNIEEGTNQKTGPSYIEAHKSYLEMMSISQDKKTGLISISVEHISPIFAQSFLSLIIKEANNLDREIDIESSSKALNYLKTELSQTSLVEIKKSINQLIEAQLETRMMASIHEEYSLISLEPPYVPEEKSKPVRSQIVILATILGGLLSVVVVLIRYFTSRKKLV